MKIQPLEKYLYQYRLKQHPQTIRNCHGLRARAIRKVSMRDPFSIVRDTNMFHCTMVFSICLRIGFFPLLVLKGIHHYWRVLPCNP